MPGTQTMQRHLQHAAQRHALPTRRHPHHHHNDTTTNRNNPRTRPQTTTRHDTPRHQTHLTNYIGTPPIAFAAAWLSSCGTAVMAWVAHACGSPAWASLAWPSGIRGSLLALAAAIMMMSIIAAACRLRGNGTGTRYRRPAGERITTWLTETRAMLDDSWQSTPRTDTSPPTSQPPA